MLQLIVSAALTSARLAYHVRYSVGLRTWHSAISNIAASQVGYVLNLSFWALDTELLKMTPSGEKGAVGFHIRRLHRNPLFSTIRFLSLLNSLSNLPPSLRGKEAKMKTLPISRFLAFFTVRLASADPVHLLDASISCPVWRFWPLNETFRRPILMAESSCLLAKSVELQ